MSKLLPCPFCGYPARVNTDSPSPDYYQVSCATCDITTNPTLSESTAMAVWNTRAEDWTRCLDELPAIGKPVLIKSNGVTQHITYMLDGFSETDYWFEPYCFGANGDDNLMIKPCDVESWVYVDGI